MPWLGLPGNNTPSSFIRQEPPVREKAPAIFVAPFPVLGTSRGEQRRVLHAGIRFTGLDPTSGTFESRQGIKSTEGVLASIRSQCTVRALFIKPQDPIMGQLLYEAATFMLENRANAIAATLGLAIQYGLPQQRAAELQIRADAVLKNSQVLGRPSALGVWLSRWKYWLIFIQAVFLGFIIPVACVLKKQSGQVD